MLAEETHWPVLRQRLPDGTRAVGALVLYWADPHRMTDEEADAVRLLAVTAAGYVANLSLPSDDDRLAGSCGPSRPRGAPGGIDRMSEAGSTALMCALQWLSRSALAL